MEHLRSEGMGGQYATKLRTVLTVSRDGMRVGLAGFGTQSDKVQAMASTTIDSEGRMGYGVTENGCERWYTVG